MNSQKGFLAMFSGRSEKELHRQVLEWAPQAVVRLNEQGHVLFFNAAAERLWGLSRAQVLGQPIEYVIPELSVQQRRLFEAPRLSHQGESAPPASCELKLLLPSGHQLWVNVQIAYLQAERKSSVTLFVRDITQEREAMDALNQTLEQALDAVVSIDQQNRVIFFNASAEKLWGYSRAEVMGQNVKLLVPEAIRASHDDLVNANRNGGADKIVGTSRDVQITRKDGRQVWGNLSLSKVSLSDRTLYTAFVKDISRERDAREVVNQTLEQALDAVVTIDEHNCVTFYNAAAERMWGYSREEVLGQNVKMLVPQLIRANHDKLVDANRHGGADKIVGTSRDVQIERKDGSTIWGNLSLSKIRLGQSIIYTAFIKDISSERNAREVVSQTLEQALDAVVTIDHQNNVTFFNAAAERLWGYPRAEVLGRNVKMLVPQMIQSRHDDMVNSHRNGGVDKIVGTSRNV